MPELECPACSVVYELDSIPVARECPDCGEIILPLDVERAARIRAETAAEVEECYRLARENPLPEDQARALYLRVAQTLIDRFAGRGADHPFRGKTADEMVNEVMLARAERIAKEGT